MGRSRSQCTGYTVAALLGAVAGGIMVVLANNAIGKILSNVMGNMMARMAESGCDLCEK